MPYTATDSINQKLDSLERIGVISEVQYSKWAAPTVYIKKKNKDIRVSADFSKGLNECLKTYVYPLLCAEDIFIKLNGGKIFVKLDLSNVLWSIKKLRSFSLLTLEEVYIVLTVYHSDVKEHRVYSKNNG